MTHHAATTTQPPLIGLLNVTDPVQSLLQFRESRGYDPTPQTQVLSDAHQPYKFTSADICGVSVVGGFVVGAAVTFILLYTEMYRIKRWKY